MKNRVKAFIPAAGLGMRLRPITEIIPKELFPIGRKPLLQCTIERLRDAGISDIIIALNNKGVHQKALHTYFQNGKRFNVSITYVYAPPTGLDKAFLAAKKHLHGHPFLFSASDMLVSDSLIFTKLMALYAEYKTGILVLRKESVESSRRFAMVNHTPFRKQLVRISGFVEKPISYQNKDILLSSVGIMMLPENFYKFLFTKEKEVPLSRSLEALTDSTNLFGYIAKEKIYDCSDLDEWISANRRVLFEEKKSLHI